METKDKKRIVVDIDSTMHDELKIKAITEGKTIREVMLEFVNKYIRSNK